MDFGNLKKVLKKATEYDTLKMSETGGIIGRCKYGSITNRDVGCGQGEGKRSRKQERKSKKKWKVKRAMPNDFSVWTSALNVSKVLVSYVLYCFCFNHCSVFKKNLRMTTCDTVEFQLNIHKLKTKQLNYLVFFSVL